jgi:hypothetical protein
LKSFEPGSYLHRFLFYLAASVLLFVCRVQRFRVQEL